MNFTIHLLRDNNPVEMGYVAFATDKNEKVVKATIGSSIDYSKALLHVSIIFEALGKSYPTATVRFYIENEYEKPLKVSCSLDSFAVNTEDTESYYKELYDLYSTLAITKSEVEAFQEIVKRKSLSEPQAIKFLSHIQNIRTNTIE